MSKKSLVSIIVNCHNGEKYLENCLKSIFSQTHKDWEIIFWDNFSTDNSKKILEKFSDKRIKYFHANKFTSLYEARNLAIEKAEGEYISFLDTDDLWINDKIEKQIHFLQKNKQFKIVYSNYYVLEENKNKKYIQHKKSLPSGSITQKLLDYYSLGILTVFLETSLFQKYKFKKNYNVIGDFDFFINLSENFEIASIQEPLAFYRVHDSNFSRKEIKIYIRELTEWIQENNEKMARNGFSLKKQKFFLTKLKVKSLIKRFYPFFN